MTKNTALHERVLKQLIDNTDAIKLFNNRDDTLTLYEVEDGEITLTVLHNNEVLDIIKHLNKDRTLHILHDKIRYSQNLKYEVTTFGDDDYILTINIFY